MKTESDVDELIDELFDKSKIKVQPQEESTTSRLYPEHFLNSTPQGHKYYHALQQCTRQFIDDSSEGRVVKFGDSNLSIRSRKKVSEWDGNGAQEAVASVKSDTSPSVPKTASTLFSWSSGDSYIRARKEELRSSSKSPIPVTSPTKANSNKPKKTHFSTRLNSVVETESNKFIQDRIDVIKARRLEQASKRVSERKQRDHDRYIERMRKKEEEYDKALNAAIKSKKDSKNPNFLGALFGFGRSSKTSSRSDVSDATSDIHTITSTKSSLDTTAGETAIGTNQVQSPDRSSINMKDISHESLSHHLPGISASASIPEPVIVGIDDAFSNISDKSNTTVRNTSNLDELLGSPSSNCSNPVSPQKHKFIPVGNIANREKPNNDSENLLQL
ncbi:hypothetical protein CJJ07_000183 [Candidozyma auris]|nr:hypothetical protein CJJ07_000183 [[Candida] auris]QEL61000.1 hypothetical protein CJJ09_003136 [[Candida] auris]